MGTLGIQVNRRRVGGYRERKYARADLGAKANVGFRGAGQVWLAGVKRHITHLLKKTRMRKKAENEIPTGTKYYA